MSEEVIYNDDAVSVSTSRVIINGTTYALRNITSVKMTVTPAKKGCAIVLIIVGALFTLCLVGVKGGAAPALIIGGILVGGGILWLNAAKPDYHVAISSSAAERPAMTHKDKSYIQKVVDAINEAIVRYR